MATIGTKRRHEVLEEPEETLLEPWCLRCAEGMIDCSCRCGGPMPGSSSCHFCKEINVPCSEVPVRLAWALNAVIRERNYLKSLYGGNKSSHQRDLSYKFRVYMIAAEEYKAKNPVKPPDHEAHATSLQSEQFKELQKSNQGLHTIHNDPSQLEQLNETLAKIADHLGVLAEAKTPKVSVGETEVRPMSPCGSVLSRSMMEDSEDSDTLQGQYQAVLGGAETPASAAATAPDIGLGNATVDGDQYKFMF